MEKNEELLSSIFNLGQIIKNKMHKSGQLSDFSHAEIEVLKFLKENEKSTMKEIAGYLRIRPASATPLVEMISDKKCVERLQDKGDRRIIYIRLTKKGQAKLKNAYKHIHNNLKEIFLRLSNDDKKDLIRILNIIISKN